MLAWERYAVALYSMSATLTDVPAAQDMRLRAKAAFKRSRQLGNTSALAALAEEIAAFGSLLAFADEQEARGQPIKDPQIATIRGLRERGLLESYVLLHTPTAGISRDYPAYRAEHRDRLQAYVDAMVVMPTR